MNDWLRTFGPTGVSLLFNDRFLRTLQRALYGMKRGAIFVAGTVKRGAVLVAGYVGLKMVGFYFRFLAPKEVVEQAGKLVFFLAIGFILSKVMEEIPKTSDPRAETWPI
jgi:hypothetical protein